MIIGLTGYAQSGKDTVASILIKHYGFTRIAFADKIRDLLYEMDPQIQVGYDITTTIKTLVDESGWDEAKQLPQVRQHLQNLGVGARKVFGNLFWVEQAMRGIGYYENVVVTDVRFKNEADFIKKYERSQIWRIKRPEVTAVNNHISETEMEDYKVDQILTNRGTIKDLELLVQTRMQGLL